MAAGSFRITTDDTEWDGMDSSGIMTATRFLTVTADGGDQLTLAESNVIPQRGDAHPQHASWIVDSIGKIRHADMPNEYRLEVKYRKASGSGVDVKYGGNSEAKPWEMGVQNMHRGWTTVNKPLTRIFIPSDEAIAGDPPGGGYKDLTNSAGQVIPAMAETAVLVLSFELNFEIRRGSRHKIASPGTLNSMVEEVLGETVSPYSGKIMRMSSAEHKVYKNDGKTVKWHYETVSYEIHLMMPPWKRWNMDYLNVGNMAKFPIPGESNKYVAKQIFQYTPWVSKYPDVNACVAPKFGCIDDVIAARNAYKKATGDSSKEIPWCEAENIPLKYEDGTIDMGALKGDHDYAHISGYPHEGESWSQYDIPKKAD